ncbi:Chromodomain-helicase-DNA-binding protein, putative [Hondaea fermentalgiana]|uniref:Chromodomain-helicase-DNA-binding protein, putative n=1 Tax=Hondaea fermentalgiana TaxID=2315210 RepID=A0A2R5G1N3_9STRA|nr:Chromodomain-helicase-DNA-binding protein, putative [Hondaea fermentalgiana]|eukprot:GBG24435.1 Chromodomain-helicase-DNA-binding protein, putative [Hondaea fermentalgiana]
MGPGTCRSSSTSSRHGAVMQGGYSQQQHQQHMQQQYHQQQHMQHMHMPVANTARTAPRPTRPPGLPPATSAMRDDDDDDYNGRGSTSARKKKKSLAEDKLMGEHEAFFEEMDREDAAAPREREEPLIENILGRRLRADYDPEQEEAPASGDEDGDKPSAALLESVETPKKKKTRRELLEEEDEKRRREQDKFEFLVKWRGKSYLHVEWVSPDLIDQDVNGSQRLKRYVNALPPEQHEASAVARGREDTEYFDPSYVEVDRILDEAQEEPGTQRKRTPSWVREATQILSKLINHRYKGVKLSVYFMEPVDEERDGAPGYYDMISRPMDFGTIRQRLMGGRVYENVDQFAADVRLVFANCRIYNTNPELFVRDCCERLSDLFEKKFATLKAGQENQANKDDDKAAGPMYLVKWKNMSYADATWENASDILDDQAIAAYHRRSKIPAVKRQAIQNTSIESKITTERQVLAQQQNLHRHRVQEHLQRQDQALRQRQEHEINAVRERHRQQIAQFQYQQQNDPNLAKGDAAYGNFPSFSAYVQHVQQTHHGVIEQLNQQHAEQQRALHMQQKQHIRHMNSQLEAQDQQLQQRHEHWRTQMQQNEEVDSAAVANAAEGSMATSASGSRFFKYTESPSFKDGLKLRSYQLEGLNWLAFNYANKRGSLLADEMGLGKTCQTVSFVRHLKLHGNPPNRPSLVVAPLSTLGHWRNEFERWTDLNCVVYHDGGNRRITGQQARALIREHEFYYWRKNSKTGQAKVVPGLYKFDVMVTSYEALSADGAEFADIKWAGVIVDEGHRLKSKKSKLAQTFAEYIRADVRVILTGTPLQNNVGELWALLNFIEPREFPDKADFLEHFGDMQNAEQVQALQARVKPFMLRRLKEHVEKDIPAKEETVIDVELTTLQKKYYRAIFERNREFLGGGPGVVTSSRGVSPQLISIEMELRKCCNHPFLISGVEQREALTTDVKYDSEEWLVHMINASGKMVLLDKLLAKLRKEGRKVLIFSQFKMMLDIISDYCAHPRRAYPVERIDGNVSGNARQKAIDRFCDPVAKSFVFLLSTRAGGVGINLTAADTVIIFDSDWNPQNDLQAMARCHRIGQKKSVNVYRFVTRLTYEAHLFDRAAKKLGLEQAVLGRQGSSAVAEPASKEEIEELLKYGAYRLLEDDEEAAKKQKAYSEANIDDLLKDSRKVNWDRAADADNTGGFSFSKASFVAAGTDQEIDVQDPKFWTKVLGEDPRGTMVARLTDGSAYETEEKKQAFFTELRVVGHQVIEEKLRGNPTPDYEQDVVNCLQMIVTMKRTFSDREQAAANQFVKQIERPSRRNYDVSKIKTFFDGERLPGSDEPSPAQGGPEKVSFDDGGDDDANDDDYTGGGSSSNNKKPRRWADVDGRKVEMLIIQGKWIDPEILRQTVDDFGGYEKVVVERLWQSIRRKLELRETSSCGHQIHKAYKKYFYADPSQVPIVDVDEARRVKKAQKEKRQQEETAERKRRRSEGGTKRQRSAKKTKRSRDSSAASASGSTSSRARPVRKNQEVKVEILDPSTYEKLDEEGKPWCRYCGATETSSWSRGPWGSQTLCIAHYSQHYQKKSLDLSEYPELPKQPINPEANTQFKYLARKKAKEERLREDGSMVGDEELGLDDDLDVDEDEDNDSNYGRGRSRRVTRRASLRRRASSSRRRSATVAAEALAAAVKADEDDDDDGDDDEDEDADMQDSPKENGKGTNSTTATKKESDASKNANGKSNGAGDDVSAADEDEDEEEADVDDEDEEYEEGKNSSSGKRGSASKKSSRKSTAKKAASKAALKEASDGEAGSGSETGDAPNGKGSSAEEAKTKVKRRSSAGSRSRDKNNKDSDPDTDVEENGRQGSSKVPSIEEDEALARRLHNRRASTRRRSSLS